MKMKIQKALAIMIIMVGAIFIGQSVSIPTNNSFVIEKRTPLNYIENESTSLLHSRKVVVPKQQREITQQYAQENKPVGDRSIKIAEDESEFVQLQSTLSGLEKRSHNLSAHPKISLSSPNFYRDKLYLKKIGSNFGRSHAVKIRTRRNLPIDGDIFSGSGLSSNEYTNTEDDSESDPETLDTNDHGFDIPNVVSKTTTTAEMDETLLHKIVVRKCCPRGKTFLQSRAPCTRSSNPLITHFQPRSTNGTRLQYNDHTPCAFGGHRLQPLNEKYSISDNGFLIFRNKTLSPEEYCFEAFLESNNILPVVCYKHKSYYSSAYIHIILGKAITMPFLLITLIIYIYIAELQNTFGIAILCHTATLLFSYIVFITLEHVYPYISLGSCRTYAFVIFIMFQSSFYWLNVMCYDLCWLLCMLKTLNKKLKLNLYSCYAWGMPLIFVLICLHRSIVPGIPAHHFKPEYGNGGCLYSVHLDHFYPPVIVLQVCNIILLAGAFFKMLCSNRDALEKQSKQLVKNKQQYDMYILYYKLLLVKGLVTSTIIIMWVLDARIILWYLINVQEICICITVVFNDNILRLINKRKYYWSEEFSFSFRHKPEGRYCKQNLEGNCNVNIHNHKNNTVDLEMKTFDS